MFSAGSSSDSEARERGLWTWRAMLAPERGTGKWEMTALGSCSRGPTLERH